VRVIRAPRRDDLMAWLSERGVSTGIFYPVPLHLQGAYSHLGYKSGDFPETERRQRKRWHCRYFPAISAVTEGGSSVGCTTGSATLNLRRRPAASSGPRTF
jgi:dTDP-4-amino-4,6-dideoxygalactose transaminase